MTRECRGKCTAYLSDRRMLVAVGRAVPWPSQVKNREKSREQLYLLVCSRLTRKGDRLKRLDGHENEEPWNAGLLFYLSNWKAIWQKLHHKRPGVIHLF